MLQLVAERGDLIARGLAALDFDAEIPPGPPAPDERQPAAEVARQHPSLDVDEDGRLIEMADQRPE